MLNQRRRLLITSGNAGHSMLMLNGGRINPIQSDGGDYALKDDG